MNAMARPGTAESFDLQDAQYPLEPPSPTKLHGRSYSLGQHGDHVKKANADGNDHSSKDVEVRHHGGVSNTTYSAYPSSSFPQSSVVSLSASAGLPIADDLPTPPSSATSKTDKMLSLLLPSYPTTEAALEGVTILSATVMRRMPVNVSSSAFSRLGNAGPGHSPSRSKGSWQTHQLVLTSLRLDTRVSSSSQEDPSGTQTIAFLHLFGNASRFPPQPGSAGLTHNNRAPTEALPKVEVERVAIGPATMAGVWENDDTAEMERSSGRRWVLRVRFSEEQEEWLCDMPTG